MESPSPATVNDRKTTLGDIIICVVGVLFSLQVLAVGLSAPVFEEMYSSFGSRLSLLSRGLFQSSNIWTLAGVGGIVWSIRLCTLSRVKRSKVRRIALTIAVLSFLLGQTLTVALFLPIFHLESIIGETPEVQTDTR